MKLASCQKYSAVIIVVCIRKFLEQHITSQIRNDEVLVWWLITIHGVNKTINNSFYSFIQRENFQASRIEGEQIQVCLLLFVVATFVYFELFLYCRLSFNCERTFQTRVNHCKGKVKGNLGLYVKYILIRGNDLRHPYTWLRL